MARTLSVACARLPSVLDRDQPLRLLQPENIDGHLQLYEPLMGYRGAPTSEAATYESRQLEPLLAEAWTRSKDGSSYRFRLRRGVRSAFGNELTSEDVHWTWERSLALGTVGAWIGGNAGLVDPDQVRICGRYEVEFRLPYGTTILPHLLSVIVPTVFDSTEAMSHATGGDPWALGWLRENGAGFGPYTVSKRTDDILALEANPNYWKGSLPYRHLEFVEVPDPAERGAMLHEGDVQVALGLDAPEGRSGPVVVYYVPTTWRTMLGTTYLRPPFDSVGFRHALALAIPYDRILEDGYHGQAKAMTSCISDVVIGHSPEFRQLRYAPNEAKQRLKVWLPLPTINLAYHSESAAFQRVAELLKHAFEEVGFEVELQCLNAADHGLRKLERTLDVFIDEDGPITIDGRYALGHDVNPPLEGVFDFVGYHDSEVDRLLKESLRELDERRMLRLLRDVQRIAARDLPWVPLVQQKYVIGFHDSVAGYRWYPLPRFRARDLHPRSLRRASIGAPSRAPR